ncbi:conserved hypothetical protein, partial [Streptomyces sp. SPB78]
MSGDRARTGRDGPYPRRARTGRDGPYPRRARTGRDGPYPRRARTGRDGPYPRRARGAPFRPAPYAYRARGAPTRPAPGPYRPRVSPPAAEGPAMSGKNSRTRPPRRAGCLNPPGAPAPAVQGVRRNRTPRRSPLPHRAPHPAPDASEDVAAFVRDATLWAALLARQLPDLVEELAPSAGARPASAPRAPGPAERAARAALLAVERAEALRNEQHHGLAVPGHGAAPIRLHVSDALRDIGDGVTELEEALFERLGHGRPRRAPVAERLTRIAALLGRTAADPALARHARDELR